MLAIGAHLLFYIGLVFFTAYFIICFAKRQTPYAEMFPPGMIIFICYFVFLYIVCQKLSYCNWDEFSHWGIITKNTVLTNSLVNSESCIYLKCYPPGISLFHYFITSIIGYSEGMVYFAQNIFLVSSFMALFQRIKWKQFYFLIMVFLITHNLVFIFGGLRTGSLTVDHIVGAVFGMSIASYFLFKGSDKGRIGHLIPVLFFLPLIKDIGLFLSMCVCLIIVLDYLYRFFYGESSTQENMSTKANFEAPTFSGSRLSAIKNMFLAIILLTAVIATPVVSHLSWKGWMNKYNIQKLFNTDFSLEEIQNTFSKENATQRDKETLKNFRKALYNEPIISINKIKVFGNRLEINKWISTVSVFSICLIMVLISILLQSSTLNRRRVLICQTVMVTSFLIYILGHLLIYLYSFGAYEGPRIVSFGRYMGIFFLGWIFVFIGFFIAIPKESIRSYQLSRLVLKIILIFSILIAVASYKQFLFVKKPYLQARIEVEKDLPIINKYCPLNSKIYYIWQNDDKKGLKHWIFTYGVCPRKTSLGGWSVGTPYFDGDVWTQNYTPTELLDVLKDCDYIFIAKADDKFWEQYGVLFNGIDNHKDGVILKINKTLDGSVSIQKIE